MKKITTLALALVMVLGTLTACGGAAKTAKVLDIELTNEEYAFGVDKNQPELLTQVNAFIQKIKANGQLDEICNRYFNGGTPVAVKSAVKDDSKDQLVVATNAAFEPFEYTDGGENYYGVDMEIAKLLADELGKELVIVHMDFDAVCLAVGNHQCDIAMAGLTINEERKDLVNFSDSYYEASQQIIVLSDNTEFDACKTAADVENILNAKTKDCKIGVQKGTTGNWYVAGDADWGFAGLPVTCVEYSNGSLAIQDLLNGGVDYVIIDSAPAAKITESINAVQ